MLELRRAALDDVEVLVGLLRETLIQAYQDVHSAENLQAYCEENYTVAIATAALADPKTVFTVAYRDAAPVGISVIKHRACPIALPGPSSELKQLYILASEYGQGIGRSLFANVIEEMRATGHQYLWLCVSDLNHRAQGFYKRQGLEAIGAGPILQVGNDALPSTLMTLALNGSNA